MGFLSNVVKSVKNATKVISIKNVVGVATGTKSLGSVATEAATRAVKTVLGVNTSASAAVSAVANAVPQKGVIGRAVTNAIATVAQPVNVESTIPNGALIKTASPATPVKALAKDGILNSGISLGSDKIDKIVGGVLSGGLAAAINNDDGTKKLAGAVGGAVAQTWLDKNWPFVAGGVAAIFLFFRGRRK